MNYKRDLVAEWEREQKIKAGIERAAQNIREQHEVKQKLGRKAVRLWLATRDKSVRFSH